MTDISIAELAEAYVAHSQGRQPADCDPFGIVLDMGYEDRWGEVWEVILLIARREEELEGKALAYIAAGPLEDLVCKAGPAFIDRIEHEAKFNHQFARMLTGVWGRSADPAVWARVIRFCRAFSNPLDGEYRF